eukprot:TRINITY_DN13029_c0_g1_i2.p1 TRINITY_DN13029_c0_g1~~TRINITY_DN13029_c0_g1_i2.p1  ORF type:complete len:197 (+),score=40.72 TRINITY_DN13029_c0_g1_i2:242-832(+)
MQQYLSRLRAMLISPSAPSLHPSFSFLSSNFRRSIYSLGPTASGTTKGIATATEATPTTTTDDDDDTPRGKHQPVEEVLLREEDLRERFVTGTGPGGQKINRTQNCVHLTHIPTGLIVKCQETRRLKQNREIARKILRRKIDFQLNGERSFEGKKISSLQRKKSRSKRRHAAKKIAKEGAEAADVTDGSPPTTTEW